MNTRAHSVQAWRSVHQRLVPGGRLMISKTLGFPHPRDAGAHPTISWPVGQIADYALDLGFGAAAPLLIREFADRYEAMVAGVELAERTLDLVRTNPTAALCLGGALLGAAVGSAVTRKSDGAILGAGVGALVALMIDAYLQRQTATASA